MANDKNGTIRIRTWETKLDLGGPEPGDRRFLHRLHSVHNLEDNSVGRVLGLMQRAGFRTPEKVAERAIIFGLFHMVYYRATAPAPGGWEAAEKSFA